MVSREGIDVVKDRDPQDGAKDQSTMRVPCEVYSRIVGYLRPVQNWHQGKQQEFSERKTIRVSEVIPSERKSR
jgi:anaerobic ribonucleoside-triphosphate reductase